MSKDKEMSEEDYLKKHLGDLDNPKSVMNNDIPFVAQPKVDNTRTTDLQFFNFDIKEVIPMRIVDIGYHNSRTLR